MANMGEITCYIMNNLVGLDFIEVNRIYDLKGSTYGRKVELSQEETDTKSGLKVLKDMNFIELNEIMDINPYKKAKLL
jgi:hypothetical protein